MNYSKNKTQQNWIKESKPFGKNLWSLDKILASNSIFFQAKSVSLFWIKNLKSILFKFI